MVGLFWLLECLHAFDHGRESPTMHFAFCTVHVNESAPCWMMHTLLFSMELHFQFHLLFESYISLKTVKVTPGTVAESSFDASVCSTGWWDLLCSWSCLHQTRRAHHAASPSGRLQSYRVTPTHTQMLVHFNGESLIEQWILQGWWCSEQTFGMAEIGLVWDKYCICGC